MPNSLHYDISNGSPFDNDKFIVLHFNVNSILKEGRLGELQVMCRVLKVAVLVITESKLDDTIPSSLITLQGYHEPLRRDRAVNGRYGGGCLIYISDQLTYKQNTELQSEYFEHIWADVKVGNYSFTVTTYYRPPNETAADHELFLSESDIILNKLSKHTTQNKIIASDFNFGNCYSRDPILAPKILDNSAPDLFASYGFKQLIDIPTRITQHTMSLIDLIFIQNDSIVCSYGTIPKIADHEGTVLCLDLKMEKIKPKTKTIYDYHNADVEGLINYIKMFDFNQTVFSQNICNQTEIYSKVLQNALNKFVPQKVICFRPDDPPWLNSYTRLLLRKKNRNYKLFKTASKNLSNAISNPHKSQEYITILVNKKSKAHKNSRVAANESTKANRRVQNVFYNTINSTMNRHDLSAKKKFSILLKLMNNNKFSSIPALIENGKTITDDQEKSNLLNNHFSAKATVPNPNDEVPLLFRKPEMPKFDSINTSPLEVSKIIRDHLKKSCISHCGIPGMFLGIIATPISFSISRLFNNLFENGLYPDLWKLSHVTAIFKQKGPKTNKANYRPISLLPTVSKICETVIHHRLLSHCTENNVISSKQAAYIKGDSTVNQLLLAKLNQIGIEGKLLELK